jgi:hypothetical protein
LRNKKAPDISLGLFCDSGSSWLESGEDFLDLLGFVEGAETAGADLDLD